MSKLSQLKKILIVFLAGFVLLISTACSSMDSPQTSRENVNPKTNVQKLTEQPDYDYYDANQPKRGGMNKYNDDPRLENPKLQKKVDKLVEGARANLEERNNSSAKYSDDKVAKTGQILENIEENVAQKIEKFQKNISQGTQQQMDTTKNNLEKASKNIKRAADDTSDTLVDKVDNTAKATRRTAEDTLDRIGNPS
jgi:molecular chaperone GrpE (heat shock protein)